MIQRPPYRKSKNYCPNPVVKYGIPFEADSILNPKCVGTAKWEDYWNEQLYYIKHGYQTGGIFIPGRYYYYLNFNVMTMGAGNVAPDMVDVHLEMIYLIEYCIANKKNFICAKKRRLGASELFQKAKVDYDYRFKNGAYQCGIAAGQEKFAIDFANKLRSSERFLPPELRIKKLKDNKDEIVAGYKYKSQSGELIEGGTKNTIFIRTMFSNPALFSGLFLTDVMAEECGEFPMLEKFYGHTRPCIMDGSVQIGNFWMWGTGGNMNKGGKEFKKFWDDTKNDPNWVQYMATAERFHKPFYGGCTLETPIIPNLNKEYKTFESIGVEDLVAAKEFLLKERDDLLKTKNTEKYQQHLKDYPLTESDVFRKTLVNAFDTEAMNNQMDAISSQEKKYVRCQLEYKRDAKGELKHPPEIELIIDNNVSEDGICYLVHIDFIGGFKPQYTNLFCAGLDGYDMDLSRTSKSKGGMCVIIRRNTIPNSLQLAPVATICCRPEKKEIFYEMCLRLSIFFNLNESVLCDVRTGGVMNWFQQKGMERYLAYRPKKYEAENSEQTAVWGVSLNNYSKPLMLGEMQAGVDYFCDQIWFPELLNQLQNYDIAYIGSDNDLGDAYGMALMQDTQMLADGRAPRNEKDMDRNKAFSLQDDKTTQALRGNPTALRDVNHPDKDTPEYWQQR